MNARRPASRATIAAISAALVGLVFAIYGQTRTFGFVNLDDTAYVQQNPAVLRGLSWEGLRWAFGGVHVANWHPVTWLSHMLDVELFGSSPGAHHLVSVWFHAMNALLLFALLLRATGATWASAGTAALFAVHPLRVESVAWISERKDVLSAFFLLLALHAWVGWVRTSRWQRYVASLTWFALGLLAKPMVVTTPVLLLLLDLWPLNRRPVPPTSTARWAVRRVLEKAPFFALSLSSAAITWIAQTSGGGESALSPITAWPRIANAVVSYARYLGMTVWPASLASFYPHPATIRPDVPVVPVIASGGLLVAVTAAVLVWRRSCPWAAFGWFWYLVALLPVIGFVQVGGQALADRYTYIPLIGIFVVVAWGWDTCLRRDRSIRAAQLGVAVLVLAGLSVGSYRQTRFWRDSVSLHSRSIAVDAKSWKSWYGLCEEMIARGQLDDALAPCRRALEILPSYPEAWQGVGVILGRLGRHREAIPYFQRVLELRPDSFNALMNLGSSHANLGDYADAIDAFEKALVVKPGDPEAVRRLALAQARSAGAAE